MKKELLIIAVSLVLISVIHAQTAAELEAVLESTAITNTQAASFVIRSVDSDFTGNAFEQAVERGWLKSASPDEKITLGRLSFLFMKAFEMTGGLMYRIFPGPRYAYRTMLSRNFIHGDSDPAMTVSGDRFLLILGRILSAEGDDL